jgi:hypothetical protein
MAIEEKEKNQNALQWVETQPRSRHPVHGAG